MRIVKLLLITALAFISSCSATEEKKNLSDKFIEKDEAIILFIKSASYTEDGESEKLINVLTKNKWCLHESGEKCSNSISLNSSEKNKLNNPHEIYVVKSGFYYLDELGNSKSLIKKIGSFPIAIGLGFFIGSAAGNLSENKYNFTTSPSGWNKKQNSPNFTSFEAKAGEIVYIGDLDFTFTKQKNWFKGKINLEVKDNYEEAVKFFHYRHPEYKDKPVIKRLAKTGILLDNYDAGFFW